MSVQEINIALPDHVYRRLESTAQSLDQPLSDVLLRAIEIGSPPAWDDVPEEHRKPLAAMDQLDNSALTSIAYGHRPAADTERHQALLELNAEQALTHDERLELQALRAAADKFMLERSHATSLLRWRGVPVPIPNGS